MNRERVVFFLDFANINRAARDVGIELDYAHLLEYMAEGRFLVDSYAYVPIDPRNEHTLDRLVERLWRSGYVVREKIGTVAGDTYKCDLDVEITMDILSTVYQVRPDIIVLATGDGDFVPLVKEVRRLGVRLEVASFEASASRDLRLKSSGFISLDAYLAEMTADTDTDTHEDLAADLAPPETDGRPPAVVIEETLGALPETSDISPAGAKRIPNIPNADDY